VFDEWCREYNITKDSYGESAMGAVGCAAEVAAIRAVLSFKGYTDIDTIMQRERLAPSSNPNFQGAAVPDEPPVFVDGPAPGGTTTGDAALGGHIGLA
jgi:hypothetical protein